MNHCQALCGETAEEKAKEKTSAGMMQRTQLSREQEVPPRDGGSKATATRRKRRVMMVGDFLPWGRGTN